MIERLIEEILKQKPDPLGVRKSTAEVVKKVRLVSINLNNLKKINTFIKKKIDAKEVLSLEQFGANNPTPQLIFILDALNFCFWAKKNEEKWTVEYPKGNFVSNGWFALVNSIQRAIFEGLPILDASYLANLKINEAKYIFRSATQIPIPLLNERVKILNEIGKILNKKYKGNIYNFLVKNGLDAERILPNLVKEFPSFGDYSFLGKKRINFYKRAQIFVYDLSFLPELKISNLGCLTVFADYKIPQILRAFGVLEYTPLLAEKIDNYEILPAGSREEIEIRSSTIWAGELIAFFSNLFPAQVDNVLWKASQSLPDINPYHRVLTTAY
ncbi:MAG: queuosine 5'-phosphate N-glycosylase/hydrolase [Microgenomates group bacterium]